MDSTATDRERARGLVDEAESALARGDRAAAHAALEQAASLDPTHDDLSLMSAMMHLEDAKPAKAAELAVRAIRIRPFHPAAMNLLGIACLEAERPELACRVLERTVGMVPGLDSARHNLELARLAACDGRRRGRVVDPASADIALDTASIESILKSHSPTLGVTILLRDGEEADLDACLDSVRGWTKDIVVVDGRSEGQAAPAVSSCVRIFRPDSRASRAEQRNMGMQLLASDWILLLNADESVGVASDDRLREAMTQADTLAHLVVLSCPGGEHPRRAVRLVRNAAGVRFHTGFDDDIVPSLTAWQRTWSLGLGSSAITITRPSYEPLLDLSRDTSDALDSALGDSVLSGFALTRQAALLIHEEQPEESLECARSARQRFDALPGPRSVVEIQETILIEGRSLMRLERFEELNALMTAHHGRFPSTTGTLFLEGLAAKATGATERAARVLRSALERQSEPGFAEPIPEIVGPKLPNLMGATLLETGDLAGAAEAFRMSLDREPDDLDARLGLIGIQHAEGQLEQMLRDLDALVEPHGDDPKVWLAGAIVLGRVPELSETAVAWLDEARRRFPDHTEITRKLGEAQLQSGGAEEALRTLSHLPLDEPYGLTAARMAGALVCGGELPPVSNDKVATVSEQVLQWFGRWAVFGAVSSLDRALMNIARAEQSLPGFGGRTAEWLERIGQPDAAQGVRSRI